MENIIVAAILIILILIAIKETAKHFRGQGACCGGASSKPKKKRLKNKTLKTYLLHIEGMHCQNCADNVTRAINAIDGAAAKVALGKKEAKVLCDREIDPEVIKKAVEQRGYRVTDCKIQ